LRKLKLVWFRLLLAFGFASRCTAIQS
jgi:hypothetical protein